MRISVPALLLVMLAAGATPALAQRDHMREHIRNGEILPLDRLLPDIRRSHPGTFYDAEGPVEGPDGDYRYRLKWMTPEGRIIWLDTDARTGRVLGVEGVRRRALNPPTAREYFDDKYGPQHSMEGGPPDARNQETSPPPNRFDHGRDWRGRDGNWNNRGGWSNGGHRRGH
ncbi:MAG TPA: hypothetical protein VMS78_15135 [Rhizomicrobium sp.]|nr:hypothetical protein [Rhizomicrobium sp.]